VIGKENKKLSSANAEELMPALPHVAREIPRKVHRSFSFLRYSKAGNIQ
jgi:hypothetical protein